MRRKFYGIVAALLVLLAPLGAAAADFVVLNTNNSGPGSLNRAITDANALPGADRIIFNIPGAGVQKIDVTQNPLPAVTDILTIDGYTQPGARPNDLPSGSNAVVLIQIDGKRADVLAPYVPPENGLVLGAPGCAVRGLMLTGFSNGSSSYGSTFPGSGITVDANNCVIDGNLIGTDGTSSTAFRNRCSGVRIKGGTGTLVGGDLPAARNVIGGNAIGVYVAASHVTIVGNQIGSNPPGTNSTTPQHEALGNDIGISLASFQDMNLAVQIGGTTPQLGNLISGNPKGIGVGSRNSQGAAAYGVTIQGNAIGVQPRRTAKEAVTNQTTGIEIYGSDNLIGGLAAEAGNEIAHNQTGVYVSYFYSVRDTILSNRIHANDVIGIDLDGRTYANGTETSNALGPTSNDLGDADTGGNNLQNFPIITRAGSVPSAIISEPNGSIEGSLNSTPNSEFTLQFFRYNLEPELLGTTRVKTDANGNARFIFYFYVPAADKNGSYYTATATDSAGNTSEFMPQNGPVQLANISTRGSVQTGDNILIAGFFIRSDKPKKVIIRALGPSLNFPTRLSDPYLELRDSDGGLLAKNDDWKNGQQQEVIATGIPPTRDVESAIVTTLPPGSYTAQVRGVDGDVGTSVVEVYDLDPFSAPSGRLVNISTRGFVDLLIGGIVVRGDVAERVIIRAIGPDLGVPGALQDPTLELRGSDGDLLARNDNWREQQEAEITATGLAPNDNRDSAIVAPLAPGNYTAIVRGKNGTFGVALVEFYDLKN